MTKAIVKSIGEYAISDDDEMIILFGETATPELQKVSVIQEVLEEQAIEMKAGSQLLFDDQIYNVENVGPLANENLNKLAHVAVIFSARPAVDNLSNALYVSPYVLPKIKEGTVITYQ